MNAPMTTLSMTPLSTPTLLRTPIAAALLLAAVQSHAWQTGIPNAGALLQQQQPVAPPAPQPGRPALQVVPGAASGLPASMPFVIRTIRIVGNTVFPAATLEALVADAAGTTSTLPQLEQLAARITAYYRAHGFPLSRAIVPAQAILDGSVTIQVVEARYGAVRVDNSSEVRSALLEATLATLAPGQAIAGAPLDRALLLLADIPGVAVDAVIKPGEKVGAADLDVATRHKPAALAAVVLDNGGNRYIGRARAGVTGYLTNPLRHGDVLDASILGTGDGMVYGRLGYETLLGGQGTRAGVAYSKIRYELQGDVAAIDANGTAGVASAWIRHPLLRSRDANLGAQLQYDAKRLRDRIGALDARTDRHLGNWVVSLNGDLRDDLSGGGVSAWSLGWTRGDNRFDDAEAELSDAATAQTRGRFSKWNGNASRLQQLGARDTVYVNLGLQWADGNLDSAEKMTIGGPYTVRAYDIGAVSGDTGYLASAEWRHDLGAVAAGSLQATAFVDTARVKINRDAWTSGTNTARLSGAGVGLAWSGPDAWRASLAVATPIGSEPAMPGRQSSVRAWVTASKAF
jgi:hemolysin activation/secretion protein